MNAALLESIRHVLARQGAVRLALVFGSHARGTATPTSDLDMAVAGARWRAQALTSLETDRLWFARMRDAYVQTLAKRLPNG